MDRRNFLQVAGAALTSVASSRVHMLATRRATIKAVAFDAFPIFDPRPVFALAETLFPGKGAELSGIWRARQFEYQWLRATAGRYADFLQTTDEALVFSARQLELELTQEKRSQLMQAWQELRTWPDALPVLTSLKASGVRLAFLSNMTASMLNRGIHNAALDGIFDHVLSTDRVRTYKPDPRAYQLAVDALQLRREEIAFAAFAGWDAAGAKWFGYPTVWVNRMNAPREELGAMPDETGRDLTVVSRFVNQSR